MTARSTTCRSFALISLLSAVAVHAAIPVERTVERETTVRYAGQAARPIGSIDYSGSGRDSRRFGPWDYDLNSHDRSTGVLIYDDGSLRQKTDGSEVRRQPEGTRRCATSGNVTVCK